MVSKEGVYGRRMAYVQRVNEPYNSKPGAAPLAAWLGHEVIGLHKGGYGYLLGQSVFTSSKVSLPPIETLRHGTVVGRD